MPVTADSVILELEAKIGNYRRDMARAEKAADSAFKNIGGSAKRAERQVLQSSTAISGSLRGLAGSFAAAFSAREIGGLIDGYTRFTNSLKVAGLEGEKLASVQSRLLAVGNQYGVSIEELSRLYGNAAVGAKELGGSQADIIQIITATAQSLKITGTSTQAAAGAILGLTQALASGRVKAEEFNQINEGGLRPLLQAAANSERFGGSVAKLRQAVVAGTVTSQEFFQSILKGSQQLEGQASKATLTLAGAFTSLKNSLIVYVGEASASNGATAALSAGIKGIADNLDTLAAAIGVVSAILIGRYAAGMAVGAAANLRLAATAAAAAGATTGLGVAATVAGRAILAAFGGPVGLAIAAITVGIGYAVIASYELSEAQKAVAAGTKDAADASKSARDALDKLATATGKARLESIELVKQKRKEIAASLDVARAAIQEARAKAAAASANAQSALDGATSKTGRGFEGQLGASQSAFGDKKAAENAVIKSVAKFKALEETLAAIDAGLKAPASAIVGAGGSDGKKKKGKAGKTAQQLADERLQKDQQFAAELRSLRVEQLQNELAIATNAERRLEIQGKLADIEREGRIAAINADKDLTEARRQRLIAETNKAFGFEPDGETVNTAFNSLGTARSREYAQKLQELDQQFLRDKIETLRAEAELIDSRADRLAIERRILELTQQEERDALEAANKRGEIRDIDQARVNLAKRQAAQAAGVERDNESPLERRRREIANVGNNINDELEKVQVDGLDALNEGLADAIIGAKSLGDVFSDVANSIIKDLLRIAIQQAIIGPLLGGNGGGGASGGGGIFGSILNAAGSIFGGARASGGNVSAGKLYQINENGPEIFQPSQSGKIYPTGALKAKGGGGGTVVIAPQQFDLSGVVMTEELILRLDARNRAYADEVSRRSANQALRASPGYNEQTRQLKA